MSNDNYEDLRREDPRYSDVITNRLLMFTWARDVKPFVCNECGLQFANTSNWQRHVLEHSGSRNFDCPRCHKKFFREYYLTEHLKVHTGENREDSDEV